VIALDISAREAEILGACMLALGRRFDGGDFLRPAIEDHLGGETWLLRRLGSALLREGGARAAAAVGGDAR
jgi:hypothetical protein